MKHSLWLTTVLCVALAVGLTACDDGNGGDDSGTGSDSSVPVDSGNTDTGTADTGTADSGNNGGGEFCIEECTDDMDCQISSTDAGFTCDNGRCKSSQPGCTADEECIAQLSGWATECTDDTACIANVSRCVDINNGSGTAAGRCAFMPTAGACAVGAEIMRPLLEDSTMMVAVCGQDTAECGSNSFCRLPCTDNASCTNFPGTPSCETSSGNCICMTDADCAGTTNDETSVCLSDGTCGCGADTDCDGFANGDVCTDGRCGCSAATACMGSTVFDGTMYVCAAP